MTKYTKEERDSWVDEYKKSGSTVSHFCSDNGLSTANLYSWIKKIKSPSVSNNKFVELTANGKTGQVQFVINYPNGVELKVLDRMPVRELIELITAGVRI